MQVEESQPAPQPRTTSTGTPSKRDKRAAAETIAPNSQVGLADRTTQGRTVDNPISLDELVTLDADNRRLKKLLAEQRKTQNLWLEKMLERFDAE